MRECLSAVAWCAQLCVSAHSVSPLSVVSFFRVRGRCVKSLHTGHSQHAFPRERLLHVPRPHTTDHHFPRHLCARVQDPEPLLSSWPVWDYGEPESATHGRVVSVPDARLPHERPYNSDPFGSALARRRSASSEASDHPLGDLWCSTSCITAPTHPFGEGWNLSPFLTPSSPSPSWWHHSLGGN